MTDRPPVNDASLDINERLAVRGDHHCFGCGRENPHGLKLTFFSADDGGVRCAWTPSRVNEGFDGIAHGGIITTVLDEVMGWAVYRQQFWAVTGKISVNFRRPVVIGVPTRAAARVVAENGRRITITADLHRTSDGQLLADAEAMFFKVSEDRARAWQDRYIDPAAWGGPALPA